MVYLTKEDILGRVTQSNLHIVTGGDDDILDNEELDAVSVVMSYLDHDYDTGAIFQPSGTLDYKLHPSITRMVIDIMMYNMHNGRVNPRQIPENIIELRRNAIEWLEDVANPETRTNAAFLPKKVFEKERSNNAMAWGSAPKRNNSY